MKPSRLLPFLALLFAALHPALASAQVKADLVSAETSIQPSQPFEVALHLKHNPHWHTYWKNPGTGLPTSITWTLPKGFTASDIQWPAPHVLRGPQGDIIGNGYEGDILLPITITPPDDLAPGSTVTLLASAEWLMCKEVCMPGDASLRLTLDVASGKPTVNGAIGQRLLDTVAQLPAALDTWSISATREGEEVTLTIKPTESSHTPEGLRFFSDDDFIGYDLPQAIKSDGAGGFVLTLQVSPYGPKENTRLVGDLTSENGWTATGHPRALRIDVPVSNTPPPVAASSSSSSTAPASESGLGGLAGTLLFAFIGGLILNLMPCVFPVLGIKILGFVNQSGSDRRKVIAHGLTFTIGVLLSFWVLAGVLAVLRAGGDELGWGFQLQSPVFVYGLTILLLVFALNMSGLFEFGLGATGVGSGLQMKSGFAGSFFTGVLATVVATPCSAPFLAPALGAALALPVSESFFIFTAIGIGLSTPYLLLSAFPSAVKLLPRPGAWMETFKQFMAFPLYATVGYLIWVLAGQVDESGMLMVLFGLVLTAMGAWFYGRWRSPGASARRARFGLIAGLAVFALGTWTGWPRPPAPTDVVWEKWSPEKVADLRAEGRTIYVDFTARWCATCQANKKLVFHDDEVLDYLNQHGIATLKADWTNRDPLITKALAKYQRSAVPFNIIWMPGHDQPIILPALLTPRIVLDHLKQS